MVFAKFFLRPKRPEILDPGRRFRMYDYTYHIVTKIYICDAKYLAVFARGAYDLALLAQIDGVFGRGEIGASARLDLDKTKRIFVQRDEIDLGMHRDAAACASDRDPEICGNGTEAGFFEKLNGQTLSATAKLSVRIFLALVFLWEECLHK
jgi:hypothetical protein